MFTLQRIIATMFFAIALAGTPLPAQAQDAPKVQQYLYVLRVAPALHDQARWTQADNDAVSRHFARLADAAKAGQVIFAGRTTEPLDTTFGLVVFEAAERSGRKAVHGVRPRRRRRGHVGHAAPVRAGAAAQALTAAP